MATPSGRATTPLTGAADAQPQGPRAPGAPPGKTSAAKAAQATEPAGPPTIEDRLFSEGYTFDFFQAVRLLEKRNAEAEAVGRDGPVYEEAVRFRSHLAFHFPPSAIVEIKEPDDDLPPQMTVSFFGLTGPSGVLPRAYTEQMFRLERDTKHPEKQALREWFDLFNHRLLSLFYRAWEKYRFYIPYERGEFARKEPDPFTQCLLSLAGVGLPTLRSRLRVSTIDESADHPQARAVAAIDDLALLHFAGLFAQRPRTAIGLEAILGDYFGLPIAVRQFQGSWLKLEPGDQTQLGIETSNCQLGVSTVVGERVWDVEGKIRIRIGPVNYRQFSEFLPDEAPVSDRKGFFLMSHLVRFYVGPSLAFDIQLILEPREVPQCQLASGSSPGPRLGWNTWLTSQPFTEPAADAVFAGKEVFWLNGAQN